MKKKTFIHSLLWILASTTLVHAQVIDFEEADPHTPYVTPKVEGAAAHPTFFLMNYDIDLHHWPHNTEDWHLEYVRVGGDMNGFATNISTPYETSGECSGITNTNDHPAPSSHDLGCWMVTDEGPFWTAPPNVVEIRFQQLSSNPCYEVSGLLVDIDGNEAWRMDVYEDAQYMTSKNLTTLGTPSYSTYLVSDSWGSGGSCTGCATINPNDIYNKSTSGSYLAGDGYPTYWHVKLDAPIKAVFFTYVGHQSSSARFAFDNIKLREDAAEECTTKADFFSSVRNNKGTFIADAESSVGSTIVGYSWEIEGNLFSGRSLKYTFSRKGTIPVCLTVTTINDESGVCCTDTYCKNITISNDLPPCSMEPNFSYSCYTDDCIFKFVGKEGGSNRNVTSWYWEFSDGSKYYTKEVLKTFSQPGTYDVCLTVVGNEDGDGNCCTGTYCKTMNFTNCKGIDYAINCSQDDPGHTPSLKSQQSSAAEKTPGQAGNLSSQWSEEVSDFKLYPNPAENKVILELEMKEATDNVAVDLISINGQRINLRNSLDLQAGYQSQLISLPELSPGVYLMEVSQSGKRIATERLVIK
ncbi:MAG TPA: hypothetical protein DCG19_05170 [Cryomorphaceae bacterium]|nr:hypothetical protein [Owenweeksia sp.]HAD96775.1 hypothetical protein [Cryomorphaceae bacterium]HBF19930.1 hypothetical protein [Cryomorphaceae bacterium]|tara:strand:- start:1142 stop:2881 length:1740 start_codon:yes stop_codon:yes gene_type:complete